MADTQPSPSQQPSNGSQEPPAPSSTVPPETADSAIKPDPDLDASIEQDIDMNADQNASGTADENAPGLDSLAAAPPPTKKETGLREFLGKMDDYAPIIPDAVTAHYLTLAGLPPPGTGPNQTPPHLARLLALATQKFVSDIAADSYQFARIRASNSSSANNPMGSLNAASGLGAPAGMGAAPGGAAGGDNKGGKGNTHLGIQRPGFGGGGSGGSGQGRTVLTMEDLGMAVSEYGVTVKRGEFYR
ncbi:Transcription initiation factor TFIID 23-30kDa subunit [Penicillium longicatenatum]|uniref:Transcription initiation factor TFIID 23-30kDa subunit n=1 Tax=Penicillium longicatenatum TaxID=1561947 RepID=UPI002548C061|nr:Transcription initiation factor TFIID 23-30kDa subunit [Penicillium longicatenatum]KAJ5636241.1 Transcription initiation factor TFIID 23-30kDa subunit [Penicillium longicatenatum]KAJ5656436.1 Transcription initiation factor TFIID 23-30kDa subunit [Penicillium longicatenatum]